LDVSRNLISGESALDEYKPNIPKNFWEIVTNKPKIIVADSHLKIWDHLTQTNIVNIDAHHDCGYQSRKVVDCSNWGQWGVLTGKINKFRQIYPSWRKNSKDTRWLLKPNSIRYSLPKPNSYKLIFICRSSCWTPPWYDEAFDEFVNSSNLEIEKIDPILDIDRSIDLKQAKSMRDQMEMALENKCITASMQS